MGVIGRCCGAKTGAAGSKSVATKLLRFALLLAASGSLDVAVAQQGDRDLPFDSLDGHWRGSNLEIRIEFERMLANFDPKKPFERLPLRIRNRTGAMFVFSIGNRQFIAIVGKRQMRITGDGVKDTEVLEKLPR
jgi:hypothetical protein